MYLSDKMSDGFHLIVKMLVDLYDSFFIGHIFIRYTMTERGKVLFLKMSFSFLNSPSLNDCSLSWSCSKVSMFLESKTKMIELAFIVKIYFLRDSVKMGPWPEFSVVSTWELKSKMQWTRFLQQDSRSEFIIIRTICWEVLDFSLDKQWFP
jgi:hypothetical protein